MDGYHRERLVGETIIKGGHARLDRAKWRSLIRHMYRPHIKVGKDEEKKKNVTRAPFSE